MRADHKVRVGIMFIAHHFFEQIASKAAPVGRKGNQTGTTFDPPEYQPCGVFQALAMP